MKEVICVIEDAIKGLEAAQSSRDIIAWIHVCPCVAKRISYKIGLKSNIKLNDTVYLLGVEVIENEHLPDGVIAYLNKFNEIIKTIKI